MDFEAFAVARTPALYRSAWLLCGDPHQAEDLVQETLAKVYARWHRPLGGRIETPAAYAHTTLVRTFLSYRRKRSSRELPTADPTEPVESAGGVRADEHDRTEMRLVLLAALARLSAADRAVVVLRHLEDLSVAETAARLGCSPGAVRTRSMRALTRLRDVPELTIFHDARTGGADHD